ncbi:MAG: hypothetical protein PHP67_04720 [Sphaerochaeta sp.]|uniref:hypothetical protein n=1 Tax=Sphaerochaeta sp. S2 TaxID=2798868 RepID=UPI0018E944B3|nr:hypothetical protein [Sphaerochaeta sp. S2]MCK9347850.1 hypothetical protein [Sphaerochaeta sp.]MBJ2357630.1 hypothetical protein [Sphaerochaeta sp. S2]MDD4301389.1 hypothetical protein [Sphaerochaeta sp.]MDD4647504.1 hypothetical protein [Sphaerochaeta sp.]MDY0243316.1 hypothetical protein [Sphaerochaeta sp.]
MYGRFQKHSTVRLFSNAQEAYRLLAHYYLKVTNAGGCILDYLLLPHSIDLLLSFPNTMNNLIAVDSAHLLPLFGTLGARGKHYPFSGTYELYHASHCFCELGKAGTNVLPFSLESILQVKKRARICPPSPCLF